MAIKVNNQITTYYVDQNRTVIDSDFSFPKGYNNLQMPILKNIRSSPGSYSFGQAIAIGDGKVVIGSPSGTSSDDNSGFVYLFDFEGNYGDVLARPGVIAGDEFARHVDIGYGRIVASEQQDDGIGGTDAWHGAFHLWDSVSKAYIKKVLHPEPPTTVSRGRAFGTGIKIIGGRIYVLCSTDGGNASPDYYIAVYVFDLDGEYITKFYTPGTDKFSQTKPIDGSHNRLAIPVRLSSAPPSGNYPLPSQSDYVNLHDLSGVLIKSIGLADIPLGLSGGDGLPFGDHISMGNGILAIGCSYFSPAGGLFQEGIVAIFDYDGNFLNIIRDPNPTATGGWGRMVGVGDGRIYIKKRADTEPSVYDLEGNFIGTIPMTNLVSPGDGLVYSSSDSVMTREGFAAADSLVIFGDPLGTAPVQGDKGQVFFYNTPALKDAYNNIDQEYKRKPKELFDNVVETIALYGGFLENRQLEDFDGGWEFKSNGTVWGKAGLSNKQRGTWCSNNPPLGTYYVRFTKLSGDDPDIGDAIDVWHDFTQDRKIYWSAIGANVGADMRVEISDQSDGSNILAQGFYTYLYDV